jgi:hypothetical protein
VVANPAEESLDERLEVDVSSSGVQVRYRIHQVQAEVEHDVLHVAVGGEEERGLLLFAGPRFGACPAEPGGSGRGVNRKLRKVTEMVHHRPAARLSCPLVKDKDERFGFPLPVQLGLMSLHMA